MSKFTLGSMYVAIIGRFFRWMWKDEMLATPVPLNDETALIMHYVVNYEGKYSRIFGMLKRYELERTHTTTLEELPEHHQRLAELYDKHHTRLVEYLISQEVSPEDAQEHSHLLLKHSGIVY